jgi:hypothetical protein
VSFVVRSSSSPKLVIGLCLVVSRVVFDGRESVVSGRLLGRACVGILIVYWDVS